LCGSQNSGKPGKGKSVDLAEWISTAKKESLELQSIDSEIPKALLKKIFQSHVLSLELVEKNNSEFSEFSRKCLTFLESQRPTSSELLLQLLQLREQHLWSFFGFSISNNL
jgi:hypothetical protein